MREETQITPARDHLILRTLMVAMFHQGTDSAPAVDVGAAGYAPRPCLRRMVPLAATRRGFLSATAAAWIDLSMVRLILKRLAHEQRKPFVQPLGLRCMPEGMPSPDQTNRRQTECEQIDKIGL